MSNDQQGTTSVDWEGIGEEFVRVRVAHLTIAASSDDRGPSWAVRSVPGYVGYGPADDLEDAKRQAVGAARERIEEAVTALGGTVTWEDEG